MLLTPGLAKHRDRRRGRLRQAGAAGDRPSPARFTPFTPLFNLTGQPAIALPAGFGADGLPLSVQLVGRPGAEDLLYSLAGQIEAARPWAQHQPPRLGGVARVGAEQLLGERQELGGGRGRARRPSRQASVMSRRSDGSVSVATATSVPGRSASERGGSPPPCRGPRVA